MEEKERDFREGKLPLPVGKSDWEYVAARNYCVDKTMLIRDQPQTLYALLVSAGYLKPVGGIVSARCKVKIPNHEIEQVFENDILSKLRRASRSSETEDELENAICR